MTPDNDARALLREVWVLWQTMPKDLQLRVERELEDDDETIVDCDDNCGAPTAPVTVNELRAALEHWREHGHLNGCSHGR